MKTLASMLWLLAGVATASALTLLRPTEARAAYPDRPITVVVPYAPGGVTDLAARALAESLSKRLAQSVVVVNRPGAGAAVGGNAVATAAPDGYTLGFFPLAAAIPEVFRFRYSAAYRTSDLRAIAAVAGTSMSFAVRADSPIRSLGDVVELARRKGGLLIGTPGVQTLPSMIMVLISRKEGIKLEDAAFDGDSKTLPALLGGHVEVAAIDYSAIRPSVEAGKVRVLATCTESRTEFLPGVPTVVELGYPLPYVSALGLFGPKDLPPEIVARLESLVAEVTRDAAFRERMRALNIFALYQDSAAYQRAVLRDRDNLERFFTEQGMYK